MWLLQKDTCLTHMFTVYVCRGPEVEPHSDVDTCSNHNSTDLGGRW